MATLTHEAMDAVQAIGATQQIVASFDSYNDAQQAVNYLSDRKFPVEHTAIVAEGLRYR